LFDWEKHQEQELRVLMGSKNINVEMEDRWVWRESNITEFTLKYVYIILKEEEQDEGAAMYE